MSFTSLTDLFSLRDKVALVTGASGDIGRSLAKGLAVAGAQVALTGRSQTKLELAQQELRALGIEVEIFPADLSSLDVIPTLVEQVIERFKRIDILVNCAGTNKRQPITEVSLDTYEHIMRTNLDSIYFLSREVLPHMIALGGGKIVHVGSLTSSVGLANVSVYGMTKSALSQLTKTMAIEWAEHNIQVNCLCPGFIRTDLTIPLWSDPQKSKWMLDRIPAQRPGKPDDMAGLCLYLSAPASDYMTGQTITIDGGVLAGSKW